MICFFFSSAVLQTLRAALLSTHVQHTPAHSPFPSSPLVTQPQTPHDPPKAKTSYTYREDKARLFPLHLLSLSFIQKRIAIPSLCSCHPFPFQDPKNRNYPEAKSELMAAVSSQLCASRALRATASGKPISVSRATTCFVVGWREGEREG